MPNWLFTVLSFFRLPCNSAESAGVHKMSIFFENYKDYLLLVIKQHYSIYYDVICFLSQNSKAGRYQRRNSAAKELILSNPALFTVICAFMMSFDIDKKCKHRHKMLSY